MADINRELAGANELVDQYLATADRAAAVVTDARNDLDRDLTALRWLMLPGGLALALAQLVPIWLGGGLLGKWPAPVVARVPAEVVPAASRPPSHLDSPTSPLAAWVAMSRALGLLLLT